MVFFIEAFYAQEQLFYYQAMALIKIGYRS